MLERELRLGQVLNELLGPPHDLLEQILGDIRSLALHDLLDPALPCELLEVLPVLEDVDELLGGDQVVQDDDLLLVLLDNVVVMVPQIQQFVEVGDEIHGAVGGEAALGVVPVAAELVAVALLVLLGDPDELLEVRALLVLLIVSCVDVVVVREAHEVVDLVLDDADVAAGDGVDLAATVLQQPALAGLDDLGEQFVQEPAVVDL